MVSERFADWDKEITHIIGANRDVKVAELKLRRTRGHGTAGRAFVGFDRAGSGGDPAGGPAEIRS